MSLVIDEPLDWIAFGIWLSMLLHAHGDNLLRVKGIVRLKGGERIALNGVQHMVHAPKHLSRMRNDDQRTRLVFIARDLNLETVARSLNAFQKAAGEN